MPDLMLDKCPVCGGLHNTAVEGAACEACEPPGDADTDGDGPCWCGEENPHYDDDLDETCGGTLTLDCRCGGDLCVCHNHGSVECLGCEDCEGEGFEDLDYDQYDDAHDEEADDDADR